MEKIRAKHKKTDEAQIPNSGPDYGAGLGAGRNDKVLEAKPDFLDLDNDGNKKEPMKKAAADKKKQKVKESMNLKQMKAAYQEGYAHGLRELASRFKHYEDMEEAKQYFEGYKTGLEECYGLQPNRGLVVSENPVPATVPGMADQAEQEGMGEGNAFTGKLAATPKGGSFELDGEKYKDTSSLEEFAFESLDKQLNALLNEESEVVTEGLSVSMSTGQEGSPDSVSVTGTDAEAAKLLAFIKQVGLGGMGDAEPEMAHGEPAVAVVSDYGAPKFSGHDGMAELMKKVGVDDEEGHGHKHEEVCNECGTAMSEAGCGCGPKKENVMGETETPDQLEANVAEDADEDGYDQSARNTELDNVGKPASGGATHEDANSEAGSAGAAGVSAADEAEEEQEAVSEGEKLDEWANNAGQKGTDASFERDIEFMTKVISGGLNKPKSTGQTTIPVIAGQDARTGDEDVKAWKKLAGLED